MKNYLILFLLVLLVQCFAEPDWEIVIYTNSTVAYALVTIDEIPAADGDLLGAFIEDECRGIGDIFTDQGTAYASMNIQGNIIEQVSFLVWDESIDTICSVEYTTMTNPGYDIGYPPDFLPIDAYSGNPINHYPSLEVPQSLVIPEDIPTAYDFNAFCSDPDDDDLILTAVSSEHIQAEVADMTVTLLGADNWVGFEHITFWLSDGALSVHDSIEVFVTAVNDPPQITDTYPPQGDIEIEQNEPASFAVLAQDIDSAITFQWQIDGQVLQETDYIMEYTFTETGEYLLQCIVSDEQYQVLAEWQVQVSSEPVGQSTLQSTFVVSPNPCSKQLKVCWTPLRDNPVDIAVYDVKGRKILEYSAQRSGVCYLSDIAILPQGVYFVRINNTQQSAVKKITIR